MYSPPSGTPSSLVYLPYSPETQKMCQIKINFNNDKDVYICFSHYFLTPHAATFINGIHFLKIPVPDRITSMIFFLFFARVIFTGLLDLS